MYKPICVTGISITFLRFVDLCFLQHSSVVLQMCCQQLHSTVMELTVYIPAVHTLPQIVAAIIKHCYKLLLSVTLSDTELMIRIDYYIQPFQILLHCHSQLSHSCET